MITNVIRRPEALTPDQGNRKFGQNIFRQLWITIFSKVIDPCRLIANHTCQLINMALQSIDAFIFCLHAFKPLSKMPKITCNTPINSFQDHELIQLYNDILIFPRDRAIKGQMLS